MHYSSPRTAIEERDGRRVLPPLRAHADMVDPIGFEHFVRETPRGLDVDVMLEAKGKDLALLRLREQLASRGVSVR
jgi:UV DNA damage endonuclease